MLHMIVLMSSTASMFLINISICLLVIIGFCSMDESSLRILDTSHYPLLSVELILSLSIQLDVILVPVLYRLNSGQRLEISETSTYFYFTGLRVLLRPMKR